MLFYFIILELNYYFVLGYKLTDQRSDFISRLAIQIIFLFRGRFYDFEKSVGQEQGKAIYASVYGFTSDRVSEMDAASHHGNWTESAYRLSELVTNHVFVLGSRQNPSSSSSISSSSSSSLQSYSLPASAATPDTTPSVDSSHTEQKEEYIGSERRHHIQLSSLSQSINPILNSITSNNSYKSISGDQLFKEFHENSIIPQPTDSNSIKNSLTSSLPLQPSSSSSSSSSTSSSSSSIRHSSSLPLPPSSPSPAHSSINPSLLIQQQQQHQQHKTNSSDCKVGNVG